MIFKCLVALLILLMSVNSLFATEKCEWVDGVREKAPAIIMSGECSIHELFESKFIEKLDTNTLLLSASVFAVPGSKLIISNDIFSKFKLLSSAKNFANIIIEGGELIISGVSISSYDPFTGKYDEDLKDGRAFIRVGAFVDADGKPRNGFIDVRDSTISFLGYNSIEQNEHFSAFGLSLKVHKEEELNIVQVNGSIRNSVLSNNYRGFYSYGARNIIFESNYVHNNHDYGVDPHDDSDGFIATRNTIVDNGGTGIALSRRCDNSVISQNLVSRNGKNGILIHDLSNSVSISDNFVDNNIGDGIVVHDSNEVTLSKNTISNNRNGVRLFAGSTSVVVEKNKFQDNRRSDLFILNGNVDAYNDLGDYSAHDKWNAKNISRHNDSRVRLAFINENRFISNAVIETIEAELISFSNNKYRRNVLFNIKNSNYISMDGALSQGHVSYRLRSENLGSAQYKIDAKAGSELSALNGDIIISQSPLSLFPATNQNFSLYLSRSGKNEIRTLSQDRSVQSGILKLVPLRVVNGDLKLSSYLGDFERDGEARVELVSEDWDETVLSIDSKTCSLVKIGVDNRFLRAFANGEGYVSSGVNFKLHEILEGRHGRVVLDLTCIQM